MKHPNATHQLSGHPLYPRWRAMMGRCYDKSNAKYARYGARGIRVCGRWHDPANFIADIGPPPTPNHTLDRVNVDGNYDPSNCRWATQKTQQNNRTNTRRLTVAGKTKTIGEWSEETGIPAKIIRQRIDRDNWPAINAIRIKPVRSRIYQGKWRRSYAATTKANTEGMNEWDKDV